MTLSMRMRNSKEQHNYEPTTSSHGLMGGKERIILSADSIEFRLRFLFLIGSIPSNFFTCPYMVYTTQLFVST